MGNWFIRCYKFRLDWFGYCIFSLKNFIFMDFRCIGYIWISGINENIGISMDCLFLFYN